MAEAATRPTHNPQEAAFLDYVKRAKGSVGQRFLKNLIQDSGYDAFEAFWLKMRQAIHEQQPELDLNADERQALAKAMYASSRRDVLRMGAGALLCVAATAAGCAGRQDLERTNRRWGSLLEQDKFQDGMCKIALATCLAGGGLYMMFKDNEPTERTISSIAVGKDGERNVGKLIASLDVLFKHVEMSLDETMPQRRL